MKKAKQRKEICKQNMKFWLIINNNTYGQFQMTCLIFSSIVGHFGVILVAHTFILSQ